MKERERIYLKYKGRCAYCGFSITPKTFEIDHIVPKNIGGTNDEDNLNPACRKCNRFKSVFSVAQFRCALEMQAVRLRTNAQFNRALMYGLVEIVKKPVVFYFEEQITGGE